MNKRQKIVQEQFIDDEEKVIKRLKQVYGQSLNDINGKISSLDTSIGQLQKALAGVGNDDIGDLARAFLGSKKQFTPEEAKETLQSMIQSKVYQKNYQKALQKQVSGILDTMKDKEFKIVSDYLTECYENGFIGTMFDLQGQGIPMCFPLDQEAMVRAVQLDSKISQGLYSRLGEDVALLKKKITAQVSRGISTGMSYQQVAKQLAGYTNIGFNNAVRIARTEGHRVQVQSAMDACYKAKDKGADVVKQWDSALDKRTRESHAMVDGEIRELDKPFSNGLMFPGDPDGEAAEVINCRCALLQRAKWALDDDELQTLKDRAAYYGLDKAETFDEYKKKYLKAAESPIVQEGAKETFTPAKTIEEAEEYARRFVRPEQTKYSGIVDYGKIDVDVANDINEVLTDIFNSYDAPPMRNIQLMNMREKRWQTAQAEAAYGVLSNELHINGKWYKSAKTIAAHHKEYTDLLDRVAPKIPDVIKDLAGKTDYSSRKKLAYWEAYMKSGRTNVFGVDTKGTIVHEMGHMLDFEVFKFHITGSTFDVKGSMSKYASGISAYATQDSHEYIAESFSAFWKGETDILDPELVKIFEGAKKK